MGGFLLPGPGRPGGLPGGGLPPFSVSTPQQSAAHSESPSWHPPQREWQRATSEGHIRPDLNTPIDGEEQPFQQVHLM